MIWNIVDKRTNQYRWTKVDGVAEDASHDNGVKGSDYIEESSGSDYALCEDLKNVILHEAIVWAEKRPTPVMLFL